MVCRRAGFLAFALVLSLVVLLPPARGGAQEASPVAGPPARNLSPLKGLGLPEIALVATDTALTGAPAEVAAGRYLVTLENRTADQTVEIEVLIPPAGTTIDRVLADLSADHADLGAWFYAATWAGGPNASLGQTDGVVVELTAGDWWIATDRYTQTEVQPTDTASALRVTGDLPAAGDVAGAVPVEMKEYAFAMPTAVAAGPQVWQLTNTGTQPHLLDLAGLPDGTTLAEAMEFIAFAFTGTPAATALGFEDFRDLYATTVLSPGQRVWIAVDLAPGTYGVACFVPDQKTQTFHVLLGMAQVVTAG